MGLAVAALEAVHDVALQIQAAEISRQIVARYYTGFSAAQAALFRARILGDDYVVEVAFAVGP